MEKRYVVVTTDSTRRGVFFGELVKQQNDVVILENAKMAVYWSANVKGVLGLAATGPLPGCRITPAVQKLEINGITAIMDCSPDAVESWHKEWWC